MSTAPDERAERIRLPEAYAEESRRRARDGDLRGAQLAAWAADVHMLEQLLWENGLDRAPDPVQALAAIGEAVAAAVEAAAPSLSDPAQGSGPISARAVVEAARAAMVATFDESVHGLLAERFADLAHLDDCRPADPGVPAGSTDGGPDRLGGRTPQQLVAELRTAAADCMAVADVLAAEGESDSAARLARQSDAAAFEAYLVAAATRAGDATLATVDLRWRLATREAAAEAATPGRRHRLGELVGSVERGELSRHWEAGTAS